MFTLRPFARLAIPVAAAVVFTAGCFSGPYTADWRDRNDLINREDVVLLDRYVAPRITPDRLSIVSYRFGVNERQFPQINCDIVSLRSSKDLRFDIRGIFKDANGNEVDRTSWSPVVLSPGSTYSFVAQGVRQDAVRGQVQIRRMQ